jgi:putative nucleotidyltransferase with HDIG domain
VSPQPLLTLEHDGSFEAPLRRVLVIDDDRLLCALIRAMFEDEGYVVDVASEVIEAERVLSSELPDAIVLDMGLPGVDGLFYLERLREVPQTRAIPVVAISGSEEAGRGACTAGAAAFVHKPFRPTELLATVGRVVAHGDPAAPDAKREIDAADLRRLLEIGQRQHELLNAAYIQTVGVLALALESRDFGTSQHSRRVAAYAMRLTLDVAPSLLEDPSLRWGFLLHDIGKIGIPDRILLKPGPLTDAERRQMEAHAVLGAQLLSHVPLLEQEGLRVIRSHHERWDESGYPDRLANRSIPLGARIFAIVDALDAMTDERPYRKPLSWDGAVCEVCRCRGSHFDPDIVDGFEACEPDLHRLYLQDLAAA